MSSLAHPDGNWSFDVLAAEAIDGDTAHVTVDLGFGASFRFDLRLANINAWELHAIGGQEAKVFFQTLLNDMPLICTTYRKASGTWERSFARWIGRLTNSANTDLGEAMVAAGYAVEE